MFIFILYFIFWHVKLFIIKMKNVSNSTNIILIGYNRIEICLQIENVVN